MTRSRRALSTWWLMRLRVLQAGQAGPLQPALAGGAETYRRRGCWHFGERSSLREPVKCRGRTEDLLRLMVIDLRIGGVRSFEKVVTAAFRGMRTAAAAGENITPMLQDPAPCLVSTLIRGSALAKAKTRAKARAKAMTRTGDSTRSGLALSSHRKTVLHSLSVVERALRVLWWESKLPHVAASCQISKIFHFHNTVLCLALPPFELLCFALVLLLCLALFALLCLPLLSCRRHR